MLWSSQARMTTHPSSFICSDQMAKKHDLRQRPEAMPGVVPWMPRSLNISPRCSSLPTRM